jgi:arginine deiminase
VPADIAPLKKVIVLSPGDDFSRQSYEHYSDSLMISLTYDTGAAVQHKQMVDILEGNGVETLNVLDLLDDAIAKAREAGQLEQSLKEMFPSSFQQIKERIEHLDAKALLGRNDIFYYHYDSENRFLPLIKPTIWFYYTRDDAAATPKGLILTNSKQPQRRLEHSIGRFIFEFAEELKDCTIVFDAEKEGVRCEGGDIIVKDENTILMGIHNMSEAEAAQKIAQKLSLKALLATEQRIPGLGNGILQDILFNAKMHPKKKVHTLSDKDEGVLLHSLKTTLSAIASRGGRDTELDLFGHPGGYNTILCKHTVNKPCPVCGTIIKKEAYLGGSIYYCEKCQRP